MREILLKDILDTANRRVCDLDFVEVPDYLVRVYYEPDMFDGNLGHGFYFYALESTGGICHPDVKEDDNWHPDYAFVDVVYHGSGAFDGIRHMYMGSEQTDNYGYDYYADIDTHIATLKVIGELEKKFCREKQEQSKPTIIEKAK